MAIQQYKVNKQIPAPTVRLIGEDSKQIGVVSREEALDYASGQGLDLVLISETAQPPVARVVDFKKFLYQEAKKESESKKSQKQSGMKELVVGGPFINQRDIEIRAKRITQILEKGYRLKLVVQFRGRQMDHPEFGHKVYTTLLEQLKDVAKVEREARFEGKSLVVVVGPKK